MIRSPGFVQVDKNGIIICAASLTKYHVFDQIPCINKGF